MKFLKISIFTLTVVFAISCHTVNTGIKNNNGNSSSNKYEVYKIDTVNDYYFIYAKKMDTIYKIVSKQKEKQDCNTILLGGKYDFILESIWRKEIVIDGVNVSPSGTPQVNCLSLDEKTKVCLERDSINDIYQSKNLKGLCFFK